MTDDHTSSVLAKRGKRRMRGVRRRWLLLLLFLTAIMFSIVGLGMVSCSSIFSNKGYAKQLTVKASLMSEREFVQYIGKEDCSSWISHDPPKQETSEKRHLVVEIINNGNWAAWGILTCEFGNRRIDVDVPHLWAGGGKVHLYVVDVEAFVFPSRVQSHDVHTHWKRLSTK